MDWVPKTKIFEKWVPIEWLVMFTAQRSEKKFSKTIEVPKTIARFRKKKKVPLLFSHNLYFP